MNTVLEKDVLNTSQKNIEKLKRYKAVFGHCNIPANWKTDIELAQWVQYIRLNKYNLSVEFREELEKIGFSFRTRISKKDEWNIRYKQIQEFYNEMGHSNIPTRVPEYSKLFYWAKKQKQDKHLLSQEQIDKLNQLNFEWKIGAAKEKHWDEMYFQLEDFFKKYGHSRVVAGWEENKQLAKWVGRQRSEEEKLTKYRKQKLNDLDFAWKTDIQKIKRNKWNDWYKQLKDFYDANGHCRVPSVDEKYHRLRVWVDGQRKKEDAIPSHRKNKLNELNFPWKKDIRRSSELDWLKMYRQLKSYYQEFGHSRVPSRYKANPPLAAWVGKQRLRYHSLAEDKIYKLNQLNFFWRKDIRKAIYEEWEKMYSQLADYYKKYGNSRVPDSYLENAKLGRWVSTQRINRENLTPLQFEKLEKVNFVWSEEIQKELEEQWEKMYKQLQEFREENGHCKVADSWEKNPKLANWVVTQRQNKANLSAERLEKLNEIDFLWSGHQKEKFDEHWEQMYVYLKAFKKKYGHCNVPIDWEENIKLYRWVHHQRKVELKMNPERKKRLERLGFLWKKDISNETKWETMYIKLKGFYEKYGNSKVPDAWKEDTKLANWVAEQRQKRASILPERIEKLQQLNFIWREDIELEKETQWNDMFEKLHKYYMKKGHSKVLVREDKKLAAWVFRQRSRKDQLAEDKKIRLNGVNFVWEDVRKNTAQESWDKSFFELKRYYEEKGHCRVTSAEIKYKHLSDWIIRQRKKKYLLTLDQIEKLKSINFQWKEAREVLSESWNEMFHQLKAYYDKHGHSRVKQDKKSRNKLAAWVSKQRQKAKSLNPEQKQKLNSVDFLWTNDMKKLLEDVWTTRYKELKEFYKKFGHYKVPVRWSENKKLGLWLDNLKRRHSGISEDKRRQLQDLGIDWLM